MRERSIQPSLDSDTTPAMTRVPAIVVAIACLHIGCKKSAKPVPQDGPETVDPAELAGTLDKKCVAGDLEACRQLGVIYQEGTGVSPDLRRATALFGQACTGNNLSACNNLGMNLAEGIGVDKNPTRATEVYARACDGGMKLACRNLGLMYRDGRGVPADFAKADQLLDKACKANVPFACKNAGDLDAMMSTKGPTPKWKQAINHYKLGCDSGDPTACRQIGVMYLEGKGLPKSSTAAAVWLERACLPDDPIACRVLGQMVLQGVGVARDADRGKQLLTRACDAKDDEACRILKQAPDDVPGDGGVAEPSGSGSASGTGGSAGSANSSGSSAAAARGAPAPRTPTGT
jgi:TPR repeat protein